MVHRITLYEDIERKKQLDFFDEIPLFLLDKHIIIRPDESLEFERLEQITTVVKYILTQTLTYFKID